MADLNLVTANKVNVGTITVQQHTFVAGEAITAGAPVYLKGADGKVYNSDADLAGANTLWGVATRTVAAGEAVTVVRRGLLDGFDLSALNYGAAVFVSNTGGRLADAAGTASLKVGTVVPAMATTRGTAFDKILMVEVNNDAA